MNKFALKLHNHRVNGDNVYWEDKFDEIMKLTQNFQAIDVNLDDSNGQNATELFVKLSLRHGSHIRKMVLHKAEFRHSKDFRNILRNLPLLEELEISRTSFKLPESEEHFKIQPVVLRKLKSIRVVYSSWIFFQYLVGSQISTLILSTAQVRLSERENLINFLEASEKLESIEMDREAFERIFQSNFSRSFPFKLKRLKFFSYTFKSEVNQVDENFIEFLESQASSIQDLALEYSSREILQTIFTKLVHLRRLKLNSNSLPTDKEFYDQLTTFKHLKEIDADDRIPNDIAAKGLLRNCPNLEILKVECDPNDVIAEILPFILTHNPKIKNLLIDCLKIQHLPEVRFRFLKVLHVFLFKNEDYLLSFIRANPMIETLKVKWVYESTFIEKVLHELMDHTNLRHLKFGGKPETMRAIYNQIKGDYKKLRSLELNFKTDTGMHTTMVEFPEDPTEWDSQVDHFEGFK